MHADLIVMGGGIAGLSAATRAAELGKKVVVLEKGEAEGYPCNSRYTGGAMHVCFRDPTSDPDVLKRAIATSTAGFAKPDLVDAVANNAGRVITWLRDQGMLFVKGGSEEYKRWVFTPLRPQRRGLFWKGLGGDVLLRGLERKIVGLGGAVRRSSRVVEAHRSPEGEWTIRTADGVAYSSPAFLIADGGFQGSAETVRRYISPQPGHLVQRGAGTGTGDGLQIAIELGASVVGMDRFYGHVLAAQALERDDFWPYPWVDPICAASIVVNEQGQRLVDEGKGGVFIANSLARLEEPLSTWVIFDEEVWTGPGARGVIPPNPNLVLGGAAIPQADSIASLAATIGVDRDALTATVTEYNAWIASGGQSIPSIPRSVGSVVALPIAKPPFRAIRLAAGITYTMGGIAIDGNARVLGNDGNVIDGLYAAGTTTGGLEGGPQAGYVGGLIKSVSTGLLAAEHAVSRCRSVS